MSSDTHVCEKTYDLEDLERAVYNRDYENATLLLLKALQGFEQKTWDFVTLQDDGGAIRNRNKSRSKILLTRFCAAATALLSDPGLVLSRGGFEYLMLFKRYLDTVFAATDFADMSHILALIGEKTADDKVSYKNESEFLKVMVACSANSGAEILTELLNALPKELAFLFWLSLLDNEMVLTETSDHARNSLLHHGEKFASIVPSDTAMIRLVNTWMFCSYMNNPEKHNIKIHLNKIVKNYCQKKGAKQPFISKERVLKDKPTILVVCERYTSDHAMYRCYGRAISKLNKYFKTVFMSLPKRFDKKSIADFDETVILENKGVVVDIKPIIGAIVKQAPDIIFYPSIGMEAWVVSCAQYRLAPIQMMTMGHPATSHCENIDYFVGEEGFTGDASRWSETGVEVKKGTLAFSLGSLNCDIYPHINKNPETLKIAVPSIAYKLNPAVLSICKYVYETSKKNVEFHFFPNMSGINYAAIKLRLTEILPCTVYENMPYKNYMAVLSNCDIAFSPFPFGNTNGFIDCARLAIPVICLDGPETHSHIDSELSSRIGLPEFCRANSIDEYNAAAIQLIENESLRIELSQYLLDKDIDQFLFDASNDDVVEDLAELCYWVYQNHEAIQAEDIQLWNVSDREQLINSASKTEIAS